MWSVWDRNEDDGDVEKGVAAATWRREMRKAVVFIFGYFEMLSAACWNEIESNMGTMM